jgi:hypothetical protein
MGRGNKSVVQHLAMVLAVLSVTATGRVDAGAEARQDSLLGIVVVDAVSNRPIGKADVDLRRSDGVSYRSAVSDANGVAWIHLTPGTYEVFDVICAGYTYEDRRPLVAAEQGTTKRVEMPLTPNLHGVVRDPRGVSVGGAWITVVGAGREEVTSDGQGRFELAWDRRCQLREASAFCLVARQEQHNLAALIEIGRGASVFDVKLQPGMVLTGRIVDPNGRGIGGAWVYVTLDVADWGGTPLGDEQIEADGSGNFEIRAVPLGGKYTIHAYAKEYGSKDLVVDTKTVADRSLDVGLLTLASARLSVTGQVLDTQGYPVANAMIYGWGVGQPIGLNTQTDAAGRFTLAGVCAGRIDLRVDADWGGGGRLRAHVLADGGDTGLQITPLHPFRVPGPTGARMSAGPGPTPERQDMASR